MPTHLRDTAPLPLALERSTGVSLSTQLYEQVRDLILSGRLAQGVRLPATRTLAGELGVSRNTVVAAFDQLFAEGFLDGKVGSGTYVTTGALFSPERREQQSLTDRPGPSARGRSLAALAPPRSRHHRAFAVGVSAVDQFPFALWSRLLGQTWRAPGGDTMALGVPGGYQPLREAIARYLAVARAVVCTPEQVIITSGVQQAIALTCQALLDPGDRAWVEDPGYPGVTGALAGAGVSTVQVPVDDEGLCPVQGEALAPDARLACIAPSHHYPLGTVMSLTRRHALIDWAQRADGWILEDDYDSEFRYRGRPLASLQGLDRSGRVIYAGSFSKVMFPSLRLGYLVVPDHLVEIFLRVRAALDDHASLAAQPALARFMDEGHFASHIRRMRRLYGARQEYLLAAAERHLGGLLRLAPDDAGMHLLAMLEPALAERMGDAEAARLASKAGVSAVALSTYTTNVVVKPGLVLGYAAVDENESEAATQRLAQALS